MRFGYVAAAAALALAGCAIAIDHDAPGETAAPLAFGHGHPHGHAPPPGSNEMMRAPIQAAPGLEVIISDVVIPPHASVPWHYHPGEEFVYVIEGSAIHREENQPDIVLTSGDTYVIRPEARHSPVGGPTGARAVVFRVHVAGQPERILAGE
jgi:quercetin dioxygenase-like cupin family protein